MPVRRVIKNARMPRQIWSLLILGMAFASIALAPLPASFAPPQDRHFHVEASSFAYSPSILRVNPGDRVTIELTSQDVVHGIYIDGYGLEFQSDPGQTSKISFVADQSGSFRFRCSVTCGAMHPFMIGQLKVGVNWLFWRALGSAVLAAFAVFWWVRR